ncbi:hypothetical protein HOLleu_40966 [Holothuria leucospilota]|uniref:Uncharacterized protein n=1 Tax=Holothuria leucospilota TaxID=206669 RepID=A0A9Q0YFU6_HOLLE|nr:hypothetical protein HOLleu_40966 [Holothuria leucospilota]
MDPLPPPGATTEKGLQCLNKRCHLCLNTVGESTPSLTDTKGDCVSSPAHTQRVTACNFCAGCSPRGKGCLGNFLLPQEGHTGELNYKLSTEPKSCPLLGGSLPQIEDLTSYILKLGGPTTSPSNCAKFDSDSDTCKSNCVIINVAPGQGAFLLKGPKKGT